MALHDSSALVVIRYAYEAKWFPPLHRIYTYRLDTGPKRLLPQVLGYRQQVDQWLNLELEGIATFDRQVSDIVFQHQDCYECEATRLLSSMMYADGGWSPRIWVTDGQASESVMINSSQQYGDYVWRFACAHRIWDRDSDGVDEVLVYCRAFGHDENTQEHKVTREHAVLYRLGGDRMHGHEVESPESQEELYRTVCMSAAAGDLCNK